MNQETEPRRALNAMGIALFVCFIVMMAFAMGKLTGTLDPLVARRGVGALLGLMLVATGNFVPKLRLFEPATGAAHSDAIDRFAGWTFVACGLAFAAVFVLAPADTVFIVPPLIILAGFVAVLARWLMWKGKQPSGLSPQQPGRLSPLLAAGRYAMATMLASVLGTCVIFLADATWGDTVSRRLAVLFLIGLVSFSGFFAVKRSRAPRA